jgi:hypothetical protein
MLLMGKPPKYLVQFISRNCAQRLPESLASKMDTNEPLLLFAVVADGNNNQRGSFIMSLEKPCLRILFNSPQVTFLR